MVISSVELKEKTSQRGKVDVEMTEGVKALAEVNASFLEDVDCWVDSRGQKMSIKFDIFKHQREIICERIMEKVKGNKIIKSCPVAKELLNKKLAYLKA